MQQKITQTGFILTRQARDLYSPASTQIELWIATDNGAVQLFIDNERPVFFIATQDATKAQQILSQSTLFSAKNNKSESSYSIEPIALTNFQHQSISACYTVTQKAAHQAIELLTQADIVCYESDIRLLDRYLMERFIYGGITVLGQAQLIPQTKLMPQTSASTQANATQASTTQQTLNVEKAKAADYLPKLSTVSLDIECSQKGILYSVGLDSTLDSRVIMIGQAPTDNKQESTANEMMIEWVEDECALLDALEHWFACFDPDIIIGWNVVNFDCALLVKRAKWHQRTLNIGRGQQPLTYRQSSQAQNGFVYLAGRVVLDGINALKTATYQFSSWSLESVAQALLGKGKIIEASGQEKMDEINYLYAHDKPALARYNLQDCRLVTEIFNHTHLLDFLIQRTRLTGIELDRMGGSVAAFTNLYLPKLHRSGYIAPNLHPENWFASPGGYVMDSLPNLYHSVLVLDFKSLYPAIIRTFLIDPLGLVEGLKCELGNGAHQAVPGFRGGQFHRQKHHLPNIIETLWQARDQAKRDKEAAFSQAIKIIMNSFYGVLGSSGCRFFDTRLASSITMRGHEIMKQTKQLIEAQGYQVIYGDTDSLFVAVHPAQNHQQSSHAGSLTNEQADTIGHALVEHINAWWKEHIAHTYQLESALELEYETHYQRFLMPTIRGAETGSKKRYCGLIRDKDDNTSLVFKGLESARSDWTPLSQRFQKALYQLIFEDKDPKPFIRDYVNRTLNGEFDEALVYQKRLRRALHEYQKNVPPQVRAARMADEYNQKLGRPLQYQHRGRIDYLITVNGPEPKQYLQSAIDYQHYVDKQLKPVADAILPFIGLDFESIIAPQLGLF